jgi:uncharacterized protein (TIGR02996 family)
MVTKESRHAELLRAIYDAPDNDLYRMKYAEWIEQEKIGHAPNERAAFIRLQVQVATLNARNPRRFALENQAYAILDKNADLWNAHLAALGVSPVTWHRGFPIGGKVDIRNFLNNGEAITVVGVTKLLVKVNTYGLAALANCAHLAKLTSLDLGFNYIGAHGTKVLASSEHVNNLTSLNLVRNDIGAEGAKELANSPHLKNLRCLDLWGNDLGSDGTAALVTSPYFSTDLTLTVGSFAGTFAEFVEHHRQELLNRRTRRASDGNKLPPH